MIEEGKTSSKEHLRDSEDNRQLHFVGVQEQNLVGRDLPDLKETRKKRVSKRHKDLYKLKEIEGTQLHC